MARDFPPCTFWSTKLSLTVGPRPCALALHPVSALPPLIRGCICSAPGVGLPRQPQLKGSRSHCLILSYFMSSSWHSAIRSLTDWLPRSLAVCLTELGAVCEGGDQGHLVHSWVPTSTLTSANSSQTPSQAEWGPCPVWTVTV